MKRGIVFSVLFLSLITATVFVEAQSTISASNILKSQNSFQKPRGFLDYLLSSPKFSMSQSYSISYFSIGKQGFSQGLYLNTMNYRLSNPLLLQVRVGYLHPLFGNFGGMNLTNGKLFVQRAMLSYKPSNKMSFTIDYQVMPSFLYSPYYYRW